jgi:hypothetical protein
VHHTSVGQECLVRLGVPSERMQFLTQNTQERILPQGLKKIKDFVRVNPDKELH